MKHFFYEFQKTWGRRSFLLALAGVLVINIFFLWYGSIPKEGEPESKSYQALVRDLSAMQEEEKLTYLQEKKEVLEGIEFVQEILNYENWEDQKRAEIFRETALAAQPGVFEEYFSLYQSGEYLCYTGTLEQEQNLIEEVWQEAQTVFSYEEYLNQIQENQNVLSGISIFQAEEEEEDFTSRNVKKSGEDYKKLTDIEISFIPERGIRSVLENSLSDLLLILLIFLLVGMTVYEEKTKQLFFVTRATKRGHLNAIAARLAMLFFSCMLLSVIIYGSNFLYFERTLGIGNWGRSIQSVACYRESTLHLSVGEFLLLGVFTKAIIGFGIGILVLLFFMEAKHAAVPYLTGIAVLGISFLLFWLIPAVSKWNWLKYMNAAGLLRVESLYGGYTNLNFMGYPLSRLAASWCFLGIWILFGIFLNFLFFCRGRNLMMKKGKGLPKLPFLEHNSLFLHENYKILIMNKAGIILFLFVILLGYQNLSREYRITPSENYYRSMMQQLEGNLTEEKETMIQEEQKRYEKAFAELDRIDEMINSGEISREAGESMKMPYYNEVAYYSTFCRVEKQYNHVRETQGQFIYDTGYEYLLGYRDNHFHVLILLLVMGLLFAFSNVYTMERQKETWGILSATEKGRKKISRCKMLVCVVWTIGFSMVNLLSYVYSILKVYPLSMLSSGMNHLPVYYEMTLSVPIWMWLGMLVVLQAVGLSAVTCLILWFSGRVRTQLQALFLGACILLLPLWIFLP